MTELSEIRDAVRSLQKGESRCFETDLTARKLANRLVNIQDDDGYSVIFRCRKIGTGVEVTSMSRFKIVGVDERDVMKD